MSRSHQIVLALVFLTRLPLGRLLPPEVLPLSRAAWAFPLAGAVLGLLAGVPLWIMGTGLLPAALMGLDAGAEVQGQHRPDQPPEPLGHARQRDGPGEQHEEADTLRPGPGAQRPARRRIEDDLAEQADGDDQRQDSPGDMGQRFG